MKRTVTIRTCDRCGDEIPGARQVGANIIMHSRAGGGRSMEFCAGCTRSFQAFMHVPAGDV